MEQIIQKILKEIEEHPDCDIEKSIHSVMMQMGLSSEVIDEVNDAFRLADNINEKAIDLAAQREKGISRAGWISEQLTGIEAKTGKAAEDIISQITDGIESKLPSSNSQKD